MRRQPPILNTRLLTPTPGVVSLLCPAKVNLVLRVGPPLKAGPRKGYHPVVSWMVAVDWGDTLRLERLEGGASEWDLGFAVDAAVRQQVDWPLKRDLAFRAHAAMEERIGRRLAVRATLRKRVPTGAGLGGGSSDAAGMLVGLRRLFSLEIGDAELMGLGAGLGSDVAFLVRAMAGGGASAVVTGTGERVEAVELAEPLAIVLVFPPARCETAAVYRMYDAIGLGGGDWDGDAVAREVRRVAGEPLRSHDAALLRNDLGSAAMAVSPPLAEAMRGLSPPFAVTGSGSAVFRIGSVVPVGMTLPSIRCGTL